MIYIEITDSVPIETSILEQAAALALQHEAAPANAELTVVIGDDQQLHKLNQQYRSVDAPTDVLSFPAGYTDPDSDALYLGDVIISLPRAQAQAAAGGHDLAD